MSTRADRGFRSGHVLIEGAMHIYRTRDVEVVALRGVDLAVLPGETIAVLGPSGSGKSTLLTLLGGLIRPSAGSVSVAGQDLGRLSERELLAFRRSQVGILLQNPMRNLLPYAGVRENLQFAQRGNQLSSARRRRRSEELLASVGLEGMAARRATSLSGGEQQRLSLAISLANAPPVLLADEPTSQLDHETADQIAILLRETRDRYGTTVVVVTHDEELAATFDRTVSMRDGRIGAEGRQGETYAVVGRDGSLQLPADLQDDFPAGTLVRVVRTDHGVELRPRPPRSQP
jgi:putative ABC transport system ATP-binding protein